VRNGWKDMRGVMLAALGTWVSLPVAAAQGAPTADSVQEFLATMSKQVATQVSFVDSAGRTNYVTGKYTGQVTTLKGLVGKPKETVSALPEQLIDKQLPEVRVSMLEAIDALGRPNACATRISQVTAAPYDESKSTAPLVRVLTYTRSYKDEKWTYEPVTKFTDPAQVIDWGNVSISRRIDSVIVSTKGQTFSEVRLSYSTSDLDQADRIEYAMRFLAMSCGNNAASGI
jgi:hypothetical protein